MRGNRLLDRLPFSHAPVEVLYCNNLLECLGDRQAFARDVARWTGRRLWGLFHSTHLFAGTVHARLLINTAYAPPWYGHARARDLGALVDRGVVSAADYASFIADLEARESQGRYFYSVTGFAYVGRRLDLRTAKGR